MNSHKTHTSQSIQRRRPFVAPLLLLALLGCARTPDPVIPPPPVVVAPVGSNLKLTLQAGDLSAAPGSYITLPLTWQASGDQISALEAEIKFDPAQVELVGVQDENRALTHIEADEDGTALVTALLNESASAENMRLVLRFIGQSSAQIGVHLTQAVDAQGRAADIGPDAAHATVNI